VDGLITEMIETCCKSLISSSKRISKSTSVSEQKQNKSNKIFVFSAAANAISSGLIAEMETTRNRLVVTQCLAEKNICTLFHCCTERANCSQIC